MLMRVSWYAAVILAMASPVGADCGKCGSAQVKGKHHPGGRRAHAELGKPAPDFSLKDADGSVHQLSKLKGKIVVLEWTNHRCPFVQRSYNAKVMVDTCSQFKDKPVVWMAIDSSHFAEKQRDAIRAWKDKFSLPYPILLDAGGQVGQAYGARTTPHVFVIDQAGILAYAGAIDNNPYGDQENPINYVEKAIVELLAGSTVTTPQTKSYGCTIKYKS